MFNVSFCLLASLLCVSRVHSILTAAKSSATSDMSDDVKKADNAVSQSIDRDYIAGFDENYGHGSYGLSAHASYGFPEGHEGYGAYGAIEGSKHHVHHPDDHHHHHHDHHDHHKHYDYAHHKALAIKSLLVPLAGVALLGAAAAFVSNPILLQLGVISGSSLGRKKRSLTKSISQKDQIRLNEIKLLEQFMAQNPTQDIASQEKKMLANYLSCSGVTGGNLCLERVACELHSAEGTSMPTETNVLTIVVNEILDNRFVPDETKIRLSGAIERGMKNDGCGIYECKQLEGTKTKSYTQN